MVLSASGSAVDCSRLRPGLHSLRRCQLSGLVFTVQHGSGHAWCLLWWRSTWQHERSPSSPSYETRIIVADATCMCILSALLGGQAQRCFNNAFPPGSTKPGGSHERVTGSARARLLGPPYARRDGGTCDDWDRGRHGGPILTRQGATGGWNVYSLEQLLHGSGITTRCNMSSRQPHLRTRLRFVRLHVVLCWRCAAGQCNIASTTRCVQLLRLFGRLPKRFAKILGKRL